MADDKDLDDNIFGFLGKLLDSLTSIVLKLLDNKLVTLLFAVGALVGGLAWLDMAGVRDLFVALTEFVMAGGGI